MSQQDRREVRTTARQISRRRQATRLVIIILVLLISLLSLVFASASILNRAGRFTINLDPDAFSKYGISVSETKEFDNPTVLLSGTALENMWNITKEWLLNDPNNNEYYAPGYPTYESYADIDKVDGDHNGKDYIAYTFYIRNAGSEDAGYYGSLNIDSVIKGADEAARVMVFYNGVPTVYGKTPKNPRAEFATFAIDEFFEDNNTVMSITNDNFKSGEVDRFTIVIWLEGWDPECVNDIMGGALTLSMNFNVLKDGNDSG